jgi:hypothetical protein
MPAPVKIAIDVDSTLHHYWDVLAAIAKRRFGVELPYDEQVVWDIDRLTQRQLRACVEETHRPEHVLAAEPYPGAVEAIRGWHDAGHFIQITSHRSTDAHGATERWLQQIELPYDELYCSYDKVAHCIEVGVGVLIDDSPETLRRAVDAGITPATILHPWNRDVCEEEDVICAEDWPTLARRLEPVLA